ncbi:MAG: hypothetical protein U9R17_13970 [Thermodesulfobacteriota bacterium]|nr:hypothetical protein [Thermodesulfobacteriota bacterium]
MKRVYELDVYKPVEELSDKAWHDFDKTIVEKLGPRLNGFTHSTKE